MKFISDLFISSNNVGSFVIQKSVVDCVLIGNEKIVLIAILYFLLSLCNSVELHEFRNGRAYDICDIISDLISNVLVLFGSEFLIFLRM